MQRSPPFWLNEPFQLVVERTTPIDRFGGKHSRALEDTERVAVHGQDGVVKAIEENAARPLPGQPRQLGQ
jgi:hypothetical protein